MENEITISNVKNEKEEFIKNKLSEWCNKQSEGRISNFANDIKILEVTESSIYKIDFKTRFVQRSFLEQTMPFEGQNIPKQKGNLPDLWTFETKNINHSGKDIEEISKENYSKLEDPYGIGGTSFRGVFDSIFGTNDKEEVDNSHKKYVPSDDDIRNLRQRYFDDNAACYALPETYELSVCPECGGKGKVFCYKCDGSGRVLNYDNKRVYCPKCEGAKKLICGTCNGKGKVIKYIGIAEFFTFSKKIKFSENNIPTGFYTKLMESPNYKKTDSIELFQDNYKEVLTSNETISKNPDISKAIFEYIMQIGNQLNDNQRVNKYTIDISNLKILIVKYDFNGKEYTIVLFGDNYEICAPEGTYPEEIRNIETKINKNKINKTLENLDASKKSRLLTLLLCLILGFLGMHRIYVGKKNSGAFLGICVIFSFLLYGEYDLSIFLGLMLFCILLVVIDFILILLGKFKDKEDRYIKKWF